MIVQRLIDIDMRNDTLNALSKNPESVDGNVIQALAKIIVEPSHIDNTHSFALLLADINDQRFLEPLIKQITNGSPGDTPWLADYMYALIELLDSQDDFYTVPDTFVHLLGEWLLNTGGGEISWKSGDILAEIQNPLSKKYVILGATDDSLFHQTRIACLRTLVNQYVEEAQPLLEDLTSDSDSKVRDASQHALAYIKQQKSNA